MTFKKGDPVVYRDHPDGSLSGSQGIFHSYHPDYAPGYVSNVIFTSGRMVDLAEGYHEDGWFPVYSKYLQPDEIPYDPTQMGDKEDDI